VRYRWQELRIPGSFTKFRQGTDIATSRSRRNAASRSKAARACERREIWLGFDYRQACGTSTLGFGFGLGDTGMCGSCGVRLQLCLMFFEEAWECPTVSRAASGSPNIDELYYQFVLSSGSLLDDIRLPRSANVSLEHFLSSSESSSSSHCQRIHLRHQGPHLAHCSSLTVAQPSFCRETGTASTLPAC
jgi:hypothetical protein